MFSELLQLNDLQICHTLADAAIVTKVYIPQFQSKLSCTSTLETQFRVSQLSRCLGQNANRRCIILTWASILWPGYLNIHPILRVISRKVSVQRSQVNTIHLQLMCWPRNHERWATRKRGFKSACGRKFGLLRWLINPARLLPPSYHTSFPALTL